MESFNLLILGSRNAGKNAFIRIVSVIYPVEGGGCRQALVPLENSSVLEFGSVILNDDLVVYLFGCDLFVLSRPPEHFLHILRDISGFCLIVDSANPCSFYESLAFLKYTALFDPVPHIIVANKQDREDAMTVGQIRREMELPAETVILPCVATERASVANVLNILLLMIRPDLKDVIS